MEPGSSLESPFGSGGPEPSDIREETPGEEAEDGDNSILREGGGGNENTLDNMKTQCEDDDGVTGKKIEAANEEGKYEEELDPRIQASVCSTAACTVSDFFHVFNCKPMLHTAYIPLSL